MKMRFARSADKRPAFRTIPKDAAVIEGDVEPPYKPVCPKCGRSDGMYFTDIIYEKGVRYYVYKCFNDTFRGWCDGKIFARVPDPDILWVSPNGMWSIHREDVDFGFQLRIECEGMYANRYTMHPDGMYWRDNANTPEYVCEAINRILETERGRYGIWSSSI